MRYIFIIAILLACIVSGAANANQLTYTQIDTATQSEMDMIKLIRKASVKRETQVAAIDDPKHDAIEISSSRTSVPDEFEQRVANLSKMRERYGR